MPFKSQAQEKFMFANHPKMAKEFAAHTPIFSELPQRSGMGSRPGSPMNHTPDGMRNPSFGMNNIKTGNMGSTYMGILNKGYK